ncbi:MAG: sodium:solute symporter family protein [Myxococcota bacterium]
MLDAAIVAAHVVTVLTVGMVGARRNRGVTLKDFALGRGEHQSWLLIGTFGAAALDASATLGQAEWSFRVGITATFICCVGFPVADLLLAAIVAPRVRCFAGCISCGDILARCYGASGRVIGGVAVVLACLVTVGVQISALGFVGETLLGVPASRASLMGLLLVTLYSALGGMVAVALTDVVQLATVSVAVCLLAGACWIHSGGWHGLAATLPTTHMELFPTRASLFELLPLLFLFCLPLLGPSKVHRLLLADSGNQAARCLQVSALLRGLLTALVGFVGLTAFAMDPALGAGRALPAAVDTLLPVGARGVVIAGLVAAMMSTCDSFLHTGAIALIHDVLAPVWRSFQLSFPRKRESTVETAWLPWTRGAVVGLALVSVLLVHDGGSVIQLVLRRLDLWLPGIALPLLLGFLGVRGSGRGFVAAVVAGYGTCAAWNLWLTPVVGLGGLLPAIVVNGVVLLAWPGRR